MKAGGVCERCKVHGSGRWSKRDVERAQERNEGEGERMRGRGGEGGGGCEKEM